MSLDYLGAKKQKEHENEQDEKITAGGGDFVPVITTDQFTMGPDGQTPLPVIDDIKEGGTYLVKLDLSTLAPGTAFNYTLTVMTAPGQGTMQQLQWSNTLITYERSYENGTWSSWSETTLTNLALILQRYTGADGTKTQVLKNVNGVLTWVNE